MSAKPFSSKHPLDPSVVDDRRVAPGAHAEAEIVLGDQHGHLAGELARPVRKNRHVLKVLRFRPGVHDEGVIDGDAVDIVDAESFEFRIELLEVWQLVGRAGRREGAGQRKENDALSDEVVVRGLVVPPIKGSVFRRSRREPGCGR